MPVAVQRTQFNNNGTVQPAHWDYKQHGQSGLPMSDMLPHMGDVADHVCVIRSMTAKFSEHAQGNLFMHTGFPFLGYPSAGAWTSYGLGCSRAICRATWFCSPAVRRCLTVAWAILETGSCQRSIRRRSSRQTKAKPLDNIQPREPGSLQRQRLGSIGAMDKRFTASIDTNAQVEAAIKNYEMAFRMQSAVPELCEISGESEATKKLYGLDDPDRRRRPTRDSA